MERWKEAKCARYREGTDVIASQFGFLSSPFSLQSENCYL